MVQRILLVTGVAALGLLASLVGEPGQITATVPAAGYVALSGRVAIALGAVLSASLSVFDERQGPLRVRLEGALLPGLLVLGWFFGDLWLPEGAPAWLPVVGLGVTLPLALSVQSLPVASTPARLIVASARRGLILLAAFILFTGLYATRVRAMIVAPAVGLAGALLAALALSLDGRVDSDREQPVWSDTLSLSLAAGLAMAEVVWPLLFWPAPALLGGAVLLAVFYGLTGVLGAAGRRSVQLEFTVISLLALAAIIGVVLRLR